MNAQRTYKGSILVSDIVNGFKVCKTYQGLSIPEAIQKFKNQFMKGSEKK